MTLDDLKGAVADKAELTKADASKAISALFDSIQDTLRQGEKVAIPGYDAVDGSLTGIAMCQKAVS